MNSSPIGILILILSYYLLRETLEDDKLTESSARSNNGSSCRLVESGSWWDDRRLPLLSFCTCKEAWIAKSFLASLDSDLTNFSNILSCWCSSSDETEDIELVLLDEALEDWSSALWTDSENELFRTDVRTDLMGKFMVVFVLLFLVQRYREPTNFDCSVDEI